MKASGLSSWNRRVFLRYTGRIRSVEGSLFGVASKILLNIFQCMSGNNSGFNSLLGPEMLISIVYLGWICKN